MRRSLMSLAVLALLFGPVGQANAAIISSNPDVLINQAQVKFVDFGNFVGQATIAGKEFWDLDPITTTISWDIKSDLDIQDHSNIGNAFRWMELITNATGVTWTDYHLTISNTDGVFCSGDVFSGCAIIPDQTVFGLDGGLLTSTLQGNQPIITDGGRTLWFDLTNSPIGPGEGFALHASIVFLPDTGSFDITQHPTVIPEPGTLLLIGSGLVGIGVGARRRKRK